MYLYLLRHAQAENDAASDHARRLTSKGREQAAKMARFCQQKLKVDLILTSPVLRAAETAQAVLAEVLVAEFMVDPRLSCGMTPETAFEVLREFSGFSAVLLVGHQPDLGDLATRLLSRDDSIQIDFEKGSLLGIDLAALRPGAGILEFFLPVELLG